VHTTADSTTRGWAVRPFEPCRRAVLGRVGVARMRRVRRSQISPVQLPALLGPVTSKLAILSGRHHAPVFVQTATDDHAHRAL